MRNQAMARALKSREALDVTEIGKSLGNGKYQLREFIEDKDYCDPNTEAYMWSIGKRYSDGVIIASTCGDLYQNEEYECLWLR